MRQTRKHRTLRFNAELCVRSLRVGLLARGFRGSFEPSSSPSNLPQTQRSLSGSNERRLPTYSGGTAPASHRLPFYAPMGTQSDQKIQFSEIRWSPLHVKEDSLKSLLLAGSTEICRTLSHPCFSNL